MKKPIALYIHWPFCLSKCPYCDFNSHVLQQIEYKAWHDAYMSEIEYYSALIRGRNITSIFFGGGTPSLMPSNLVSSIIDKIAALGKVNSNTEITLEANPTSAEASKFKSFRQAGVNRVSIGVQSLREQDLQILGRKHNVVEAIRAINYAKESFERFSFDLIYARTSQSLSAWQEELEEALSFEASHLSLYQLTIEKGTPFYSLNAHGKLALPDNDLAADMYDWTSSYLSKAGYERYEISNYAKRGEECRHNLSYWHYDEYLGIGPGAHSRIYKEGQLKAIMNWHKPEKWLSLSLQKVGAIQRSETLTPSEILEEILMMGLRLSSGVTSEKIQKYFGCNLTDVLDNKQINYYSELGFVENREDNIRFTNKGLLMHSYLVPRLIKANIDKSLHMKTSEL